MESKNENDSKQDILNNDSNNNFIEDSNIKEPNDNNSLKDIEEEFKCINDEIDLINNNTNNNKNIEETKVEDNEEKNIIIDINIPEGAKYGIDKNGNPVEISKINKNELIAIIIQEENKENYLIDVKGNILQKTEDDYFYYKSGEEVIIIKNFDVKNPELRIFGHRKINFDEIKKNFEESIIKENKTINKNSSFLIINEKEKEKINRNLNLNFTSTYANLTNTNNLASRNKSVILDDKHHLNINVENFNFKKQMELWRRRYGKNNEFFEKNAKNNTEVINYEKPLRKYSYKKILEKSNELVTRTDSILKMATYKNKNIPQIKFESKYKKLNLSNNSKKINRIEFNRNFSYNDIKEDNYEKMKNKRKRDIDYINSKYNNFTTDLNMNRYNEEEKSQREILLKNIKAKYNKKINNNSYLINNNKVKINKYSIIDDYIYSNLKKINYIKKNKYMKCSVLKTEVNQIISNFNKNQIIKERQRIPYNTQGEKLFFQYGSDEGDVLYKKIKIIPSKIRKNKLEVYNNNFDINNSIKLDNKFFNNNYYRKIKHNKY